VVQPRITAEPPAPKEMEEDLTPAAQEDVTLPSEAADTVTETQTEDLTAIAEPVAVELEEKARQIIARQNRKPEISPIEYKQKPKKEPAS
jgi:hypothetical protein